MENSPYSPGGHGEQDRLMEAASPPLYSPPPIPRSIATMPSQDKGILANPMRPTQRTGYDARNGNDGFRSSSSSSDQDDQGDYSNPSSGANPSASMYKEEGMPKPLVTSRSWKAQSSESTPRARHSEPVELVDSVAEPSLAAHARLMAQFEDQDQEEPSKPALTNKVMTPAQFERYRQQQEYSRKNNIGDEAASDSDSDHYDDDDEAERNREAAKQRKKQEAHLSVYRQQMMKVTGEDPNARSTDKTLSQAVAHLGLLNENGKISDDEDDEVPLGILAAHGFPNKNRPPTQLASLDSTPSLRTSPQPYPTPSIMGDSRGNLPAFAKHLPPDPYYGSSIVNPSNRESMGMSGAPRSVYGGPQPPMGPGGLIGVIAGEERAKAMRRGSPNAQAGFGPPMPQGLAPNGQYYMPGMPGMPPMTPGDHAQIQMSQQMTQMMNMQMQWMQQMMQMQGMQPAGSQGPLPPPSMQPPVTSNGFLPVPGQMQRPHSMGSPTVENGPPAPQPYGRTMSMLDPNVSQWNRNSTLLPQMSGARGGPGYAPSIAPSERSNVGMPGRYRPVSTVGEPMAKPAARASIYTSGTSSPLTEKKQASATIRSIAPSKAPTGSDEDDDEGWEQMQKKREKKRSVWRSKKTGGTTSGEANNQGLGEYFS